MSEVRAIIFNNDSELIQRQLEKTKDMKKKIQYAFRSLLHRIDGLHDACPSCGSKSSLLLNSKEFKKYPTSLRSCNDCSLLYRHPTTLEEESKKFYEDEYVEKGLTTDLPNTATLRNLMKSNFSKTEKDFSKWVPLIECIANKMGKKIRVLDYGANWGYSVYQLNKLDCVDEAVGYEYSDIRRKYGENNLNVKYICEAEFTNNFDLVFSSHAIEHMHNPSVFRAHIDSLMASRAFTILTCPNGSMGALFQHPNLWRHYWGEVHPNFISDSYLLKQFNDYEGAVFNCDELGNEIVDLLHIDQLTKPPVSYLPTTGNLLGIFRSNQ